MNIVVMQERHLAALAEIERACFHAPWSENMLREELGKGIFLVAEQDGRTAGYVGCQTVLDEGHRAGADCRADSESRRKQAGVCDARGAREQCTGDSALHRSRICAGRKTEEFLQQSHRKRGFNDDFIDLKEDFAMLELRFVDAENRDFHDLTAALDEYYFMLVGEVEKRYAKYNLPHLFNCRIVAYEDGKPAGCGAWKKIDEGTFEVKRIYIAPEFRRKGVASAVIAALEQDAAKHGFTKAILETARTTEDSAALYTKLGYRVIPYYGSPAGAENCLCFEKNLGD